MLVAVALVLYAVICHMWFRPLFWTALPLAAALLLRDEGMEWRPIIVLMIPIGAVAIVAQTLGSNGGPWLALGLWLLAGLVLAAIVLGSPIRDDLLGRLPLRVLGEVADTRLSAVRLQASVERARALGGRPRPTEPAVPAPDPSLAGEILSIARKADAESRRPGVWAAAWAAHAEWLAAWAAEVAQPQADQSTRADELAIRANEAVARGAARAREIDPACAAQPPATEARTRRTP